MKVEVVTFDADPDRGGFGARVHSLVLMFSQFADVRVVETDPVPSPKVPGVEYEHLPLREPPLSRLRRVRTYYRTRFPKRRPTDRPDIVVVESLDLLGLHQYGETVPLVIDEHNVYWELLPYEMVNSPFFMSRLGRNGAIRRWLVPRLLARAKGFEIAALRRASRIIVTSGPDRDTVLAELPELRDRVHILPSCVDLGRFPGPSPSEESNDVVFIGTYNYVPNREAALFVSRDLAPKVPEARFVLVGRDPPPEALGGPNVVANGYAPALGPVLQRAAICIAPLFRGSGTRLKVLTYLAAGKAVVATRKACEGLDVRDGVHALLRDDPVEFAGAIRDLLADPGRRRELGAAGRTLVESRYDWRAYVRSLEDMSHSILSGEPVRGG